MGYAKALQKKHGLLINCESKRPDFIEVALISDSKIRIDSARHESIHLVDTNPEILSIETA